MPHKRPLTPQAAAVVPASARTVLPGGVRVVTEEIPSVRSVAVGAWVEAGSRDESDEQAGLTHFIEHVVFKGTTRRRGYQINQRMEAVGGYLNAFTDKERTCFYARGLDEHLDRALDTVLDLATSPTLPPREIEKEKDVVIEEIKMYADNPEDHIFDYVEEVLYPGHPLGRPIIGTPETVRSFARADLESYLARHFTPDRLVVAVAGNVRHENVVRLVTRHLTGFERTPQPLGRIPAGPHASREVIVQKPIQQAHLVVATRGWGAHDERRSVVSVLHTVLGGGMSSRLHQNIREKYGYCYSIYSFVNQHTDTSDLGVYVGVEAGKVERARKLVERELEKLAAERVSARMLERAKQQLKGSVMLGLESMSNRMQRLGRVELIYGRYYSLDEVLDEVERVTAEDVRAAAEALFPPERLVNVALIPN